MTTSIAFIPQTDDKFAVASPALLEVATLKPSGYLQPRGVIPAGNDKAFEGITEFFKAYYSENGRPEPVFYTRPYGDATWTTVLPEVTIPTELPEDFK